MYPFLYIRLFSEKKIIDLGRLEGAAAPPLNTPMDWDEWFKLFSTWFGRRRGILNKA